MEERFYEAQLPAISREKEIAQILSFVQSGKSCQLLSIPGAGRTTLLGLLAYNQHVRKQHLTETTDSYHFVMVQFSEIRNKPYIEALKLILLDIVDSLEDRKLGDTYEKAKGIMKESFSFNDELVLLQGIKKIVTLLTLTKGLHLVLLLDQFESYIPTLTPDFFAMLKSLKVLAKEKCCVVFSLTKPLEEMLEPNLFADFAEFVEGNTVYLSLYDSPSLSFRIESLEKVTGKTLDEKTKEEILKLTAGHAKLTRILTELALEENYEFKITNYDEILKQVQDDNRVERTLEDIWESLNPAERTHFMRDLFPSILDDEHSQYLRRVGLMTNDGITIPLFNAFVQAKKEEDTTTQATNYQTLFDKLTANELRLLQFFLKNPDTILERHAIISSVWNENKSVAGVTDAALDQLIFRLRHKIEEDPNHPEHLVTVKGRGFKFTP